MDWFERITGFAEDSYASTQSRLSVTDGKLLSDANGSKHLIGRFETPTLAVLRTTNGEYASDGLEERTRVNCLVGDARALHLEPGLAGATFQVASQFNALEMVSPHVTPEAGVTRYARDRTQGPACAVAAGAATIWRNYFLPVKGESGQTENRQLDTLAGLGQALSHRIGCDAASLWSMQNGYALPQVDGLYAIRKLLEQADEWERDALRGELAVAWHRDVEVTDAPLGERPLVNQVFCSALPVAYTAFAASEWEPFGRLVLEAAYEATLRAAWVQRANGGSATVLLTRLGGGAFGNLEEWIDDALIRSLKLVEWAGLDVCLVSYGSDHPSARRIASDWQKSESARN